MVLVMRLGPDDVLPSSRLHRTRPGELPVQRDQLGTELSGQPEIARIVGRQTGRVRQRHDAILVDRGRPHREPVPQAEDRSERIPLFRTTPTLDQADIGQLEVEQNGCNQPRAIKPGGDRVRLRLAEQQGG